MSATAKDNPAETHRKRLGLREMGAKTIGMFSLTWLATRYIFSQVPVFATVLLVSEAFLTLVPVALVWISKDVVNLLFQSATAGKTASAAAGAHAAAATVAHPATHSFSWAWMSALDRETLLLVLIGTYVVLVIINQVGTSLQWLVRNAMRDKIDALSQVRLFRKVLSMKGISCFEIPEFYNKMSNAQTGSGRAVGSSIDMMSGVFRAVLVLGASAALMAQMQAFLGVIVIFGLLPNSLFGFWVAGRRMSIFNSLAENGRFLGYYHWVLTQPGMAKEIRIFNTGDFFLRKYRERFQTSYDAMQDFRVRSGVWGTIASVFSAGTSGGIFAWLCYRAWSGALTVGDTVMYIGLVPMITGALDGMLRCAVNTYDNNLYIKHFFDFLSLPPSLPELPVEQRATISIPLRQGYELRDMSFRYPGSSQYVLKELNLKIPAGLTVAIVGRNGAGKTTLVKLLLRLYDPTEGEILLDGAPLRNYDLDSLHRQQAAVFQDFACFYLKAGENIALGDVSKPMPQERIEDAAAKAQVADFIRGLPEGYDTMLGKHFKGGVDLSGGQWQRMALARAFARDPAIIILDEPTSAMDAEAEYELYRYFQQLTDGKTGILISHRFSSIRMADYVLVLDDGRLVEQGTHQELMHNGGLYAQLFSMQAEGYLATV